MLFNIVSYYVLAAIPKDPRPVLQTAKVNCSCPGITLADKKHKM